MSLAAVILNANLPQPPYRVGGLSLLDRHLKELHKLGLRHCTIISQVQPTPERSQISTPRDMTIQTSRCSLEQLPHHLQTQFDPSDDIIFIHGNWLIDPRLLAALIQSPQPQILQAPETLPETLPVAARLSPQSRHLWASSGRDALSQVSAELKPETLNTYLSSHRGHKPIYLEAVTSETTAHRATKTIIEAAQKLSLDLPALLLHPIFENRLVKWLCNTPITPNHITLFTAFLGAIIAIFFLNGWLRLGIILAYSVAILDGVDGKLARTTLRTSKLGEIEHVLDFFVEHAWYLALTLYFVANTGTSSIWWIGGGLMVADLLDKLLYMFSRMILGKQLDEMGPFDLKFRLIGGRRNIYLWILIVGFWSGWALPAFAISCVWSLCTAAIHSVRFVYHVTQRQRTAVA